MNNSFIIQIGIANPNNPLTQQETAQHMAEMLALDPKETKKLVRLYNKTAIDYRYSVINPQLNKIKVPFISTAERMKIYENHACELAKQAIDNGIDHKYLPKITHLITVSCTGMYAPGLDIELICQLKLASNIERTCINFMGCYGVFNALKVADNICRQVPNAYVLIVSVELCSLHMQPMRTMDNMIANAIFADGAACALMSSQPSEQQNLMLKSFQCDIAANEQQAMAWYIRNEGFNIRLSSYVPMILGEHVYDLIQKLLTKLKLTVSNIDFFAVHPGGKEILAVIEKTLAISSKENQQAHDVLKNFGNMSSATILFVLKKLLSQISADHHQNNILAMAFGPGLTIESALLGVHAPRN